jgi:hypothetical protein
MLRLPEGEYLLGHPNGDIEGGVHLTVLVDTPQIVLA